MALVGKPEDLFRVKLVADSIPAGNTRHRLRSFQLTYPRILLAEINTHRMCSRSTESSRAQTIDARAAQVQARPYRPMRFGRLIRGMGAGDTLDDAAAEQASRAWEQAIWSSLLAGADMQKAGCAKEEVNRVMEPFSLCRTIITASTWDNFYALRTHATAHPAFTFLARAMYVCERRSTPKELQPGQWHLPYITDADDVPARLYAASALSVKLGVTGNPFPAERLGLWNTYHKARWSAARCARVSFNLFGKTAPTPEDDDKTWANLAGMPDGGNPAEFAWLHPAKINPGEWPYRAVHASPMEHQGTPCLTSSDSRWNGNLPGWVQFRHMIGGQNVIEFNPPDEVVREWEAAIPDAVFNGPDLY